MDEGVRNTEGLRRLHIGSGNTYLPGWINVDVFSNIKADLYSSALALPYERESFDLIYSSHVLEHFTRHFVMAALTHWRDLLVPGGILRLAVPNFKTICEYYTKTLDLQSVMGLLHGGQDSLFNVHQVSFDVFVLTKTLERVGFTEVRPWDWRKTDHADHDDYSQAYLPHLQKEGGLHMSLNLEAVK